MKDDARKIRDQLRSKYSRMEPYNKGQATQIINFVTRRGYLSRNQIAHAKRLLAGAHSHKDPGPTGYDKHKKSASYSEYKFFQKEYKEPETRRRPGNTESKTYKEFRKEMGLNGEPE